MTKLSIIISTKCKEPVILKRALLSILEGKFMWIEIIIIDQNHDRRMESLVLELQGLFPTAEMRYKNVQQTGLSRGRNYGYAMAKGEWFIYFDDDAVFTVQVLQAINTILEEKENNENPLVFYGSVLALEDGSNYLRRAIITKRIGFLNFDSVCSIGLLINKKAMEVAGLFDEQFGVGSIFGAGEESDLVLRLLEKKVPIVYSHSIQVYHPKAVANSDKSYSYGFGLGALYRKHLGFSVLSSACLIFKLWTECAIRLFLYFFFTISNKKGLATVHINYLKGFFKGFVQYEGSYSK